ncbi:MAG: iron-containing alcohol dehydrogenase [Egibacteraceae bacterium]
MDDQQIREALQTATDTQDVVLGEDVLGSVGEVFRRNFEDRSAIVIADGITWDVAGEQVQRSLDDAGCERVEPYVYPGEPVLYAKYENVEKLVEALREHDAVPIAVGSGTLNDLVKRAAHEVERPYLVVGTAASMDGYTSFGASIAKEGHKQTLECPAPRAAVLDLQVATQAPDRLTASGFGDLIGKIPAGGDWILADALGVEPIDDEVWERVQGPLRDAIANPADLQAGDRGAMEALVEGLVMSGLAMQAHQSSRPASGAEHQFSHLWEMEGLGVDHDPPLSHGFKVGLGTISIAALYERVLARDLSAIDVQALVDAWPSREEMERSVRAAHDKLEDMAVEQTLGKYVTADELAERLERLRERWPELQQWLREQLLAPEELERRLQAAGCPTRPSEIGLELEDFKATYTRSQMIRTRYTILDVAKETGILSECVEELFAPGGYWADESRH